MNWNQLENRQYISKKKLTWTRFILDSGILLDI